MLDNVKLTTVEEVNEQLKHELTPFLFKEYTDDIKAGINQVFIDVGERAKPQSLVLEDVQYFDHDVKIEYECQNKHYTMILRRGL